MRCSRTVRKHRDGLIRMVEKGLTNARREGMNNKIRLLSHRAYGYHAAEALIATVYLFCSKIQLDTPLLF